MLERWPATAGEWGPQAARGPLPIVTRVKLASDLVSALEHIHTLRPALTTGSISMADLSVVVDREGRPTALKLMLHPSRVDVGTDDVDDDRDDGAAAAEAHGSANGTGSRPGAAGRSDEGSDGAHADAGARSGRPAHLSLDTDAVAAAPCAPGTVRDVAEAGRVLTRLLTPLWPEARLFVLRADPSRAAECRAACPLTDRVLRLAPALVPAGGEQEAGSLRRDPLFWAAQQRLTFYGVASQWVEACGRQLRGLSTEADVAGAELARAVRLSAKCRDGAWAACMCACLWRLRRGA